MCGITDLGDVRLAIPGVFFTGYSRSRVEIESDWDYTPRNADPDAEGVPLRQRNAWFWEEKQVLPHAIDPEVFPRIRNQVKVSTFLFLRTEERVPSPHDSLPESAR